MIISFATKKVRYKQKHIQGAVLCERQQGERRNCLYDGTSYNREFSYINIDYQLKRNTFEEEDFSNRQTSIRQSKEEPIQTSQNHSEDSCGSGLGLSCIGSSSYNTVNAEADQEMAKMLRKKKAKRKRGMKL